MLSAVIAADGRLVSRDYSVTPAASGPDAVVAALIQSSRSTLDAAGVTAGELRAIGIGAAGLVNDTLGLVHTSPNLPGWRDYPLKQAVESALGKPVFLINDAHAAAVGELHFGAGKGCRHFVYVTVSTGIGGGLVLNGRIYEGCGGLAGELGHMVIDDQGPMCKCGNRGCWEMLASGKALAVEARRLIQEGEPTSILHYAVDAESVDARAVEQAAAAGDALALSLISRAAYYLGVGLGNIINVFNPERIVIGGGLSNIGDRLLLPAYAEAGRRAFKQPFDTVKFARAALGRDSGVIGAAVFAHQKTEQINNNGQVK
jgi:glucokinase